MRTARFSCVLGETCYEAGEQSGHGSHSAPGAADRHPQHAGPVRQRAVQHRGPHLYQQHPGDRGDRPGGGGGLRPGGDPDRRLCLPHRRGGRAPHEHPHGGRQDGGGPEDPLQQLFDAVCLLRGPDGGGVPPAAAHADGLRRQRRHLRLRQYVLHRLPLRHGVQPAGPGAEPVHHLPGLRPKGHALRHAGGGAEHHSRPGVHLRLRYGGGRGRRGHGALPAGQLPLCAAVPLQQVRARRRHLRRV